VGCNLVVLKMTCSPTKGATSQPRRLSCAPPQGAPPQLGARYGAAQEPLTSSASFAPSEAPFAW
jgi:hypothetical protein